MDPNLVAQLLELTKEVKAELIDIRKAVQSLEVRVAVLQVKAAMIAAAVAILATASMRWLFGQI